MISPGVRLYVNMRASQIADRYGKRSEARSLAALLLRLPRHAEFTLNDLAPGTTTRPVEWVVPVASDYAVVVTATTTAPFVELVGGSVQAGSKTPTGCTVIVANRSAQTVGTALFDVLIFPL